MNIGSLLSCVFAIIESVLLYFFIYFLLNTRISGIKKILFLFLGMASNFGITCYINSYPVVIRSIIYILFNLFIIQLLFIGKITIKLSLVLLSNYIFLVSDILIGNLYSFLTNENIISLLNSNIAFYELGSISKFLNLVLFSTFVLLFKKMKLEIHISNIYWNCLNTILIILIVILQFILNISPMLENKSSIYSVYIFSISIGFVLLSMLVIFFFSKILLYFQQEKNCFMLEHNNKTLKQQLSNYDSAVNSIKRFRHDLNNQLNNVRYLLKSNKTTEALEYINTLNNSVGVLVDSVSSGDSTIDAILNFKKFICEKRNINLDISIDDIPQLAMTPVDITSILANLTDNAIEATSKLPISTEKIVVKLFCYKGFFIIYIKNPFQGNLQYLHTSKLDTENHGFGLSIVDSTVRKYGGSLNIQVKDHYFTAVVMLPISTI